MADDTTRHSLARWWPRSRSWSPGATIEVGAASLAFAWVVSNDAVRALLGACVGAMVDGARSTVLLLSIDPATAVTTLGVIARIALLIAPPARALALSKRRRLAWTPLAFVVWVAVLGISLPGISTTIAWAVLVASSVTAWFAVKRPRLRAAAFLPWLVALEPLLGHSPLGDTFWSPAGLAARCTENDGKRPVDVAPEDRGTRYYAVTPVSPEVLLLTGERRSGWVRRDADGTAHLGLPIKPTANLWQGCVRGGAVWVTARGVGICAVTPTADVAAPPVQPSCHAAPGSPDLPLELDYVDAICPRDRPTIYSSQLVRGGYLELDPETDATTLHRVVPGLNLQMVERSDGRLVAITTARLCVFDTALDRVIEETVAGVVAMGVDVCQGDGALAVTDFTGRLRLFERGTDGRYRFVAGVFLPAPRRVAFSPACDRLVVTSGDDRRAFLLRRAGLEVARTYRLGPGLRDVVFVDDHQVAAADACTVTFLDADVQ
jgi:hypothetical protein